MPFPYTYRLSSTVSCRFLGWTRPCRFPTHIAYQFKAGAVTSTGRIMAGLLVDFV